MTRGFIREIPNYKKYGLYCKIFFSSLYTLKVNNLFIISYAFLVHNTIMLLYNEGENRISVYLRGRVKIPTGGDEQLMMSF